jgi:hypothetical protein
MLFWQNNLTKYASLALCLPVVLAKGWGDYGNGGGRPIYVKSGQTIQQVVSSAPANAKVIVPAGMYV